MRTSHPVPVVLFALLAACGDGGDEAIAGLEEERVGEYSHLMADFDYDEPAPSWGDHLPSPGWLNCGVYEGEVPPELAVHSLEHGAVWVALGPGASAADRAAAVELAGREPGRVIVSDVPGLARPVELVAWGFRLRLDSLDDARAAAFVDEHVDAPTAREAGAACVQGFGDPPTPPPLPVE